MLIIGTLRSFGIIYAELLETYHVGAGYTAIILSIVINSSKAVPDGNKIPLSLVQQSGTV
jgi:hypothetical protein